MNIRMVKLEDLPIEAKVSTDLPWYVDWTTVADNHKPSSVTYFETASNEDSEP